MLLSYRIVHPTFSLFHLFLSLKHLILSVSTSLILVFSPLLVLILSSPPCRPSPFSLSLSVPLPCCVLMQNGMFYTSYVSTYLCLVRQVPTSLSEMSAYPPFHLSPPHLLLLSRSLETLVEEFDSAFCSVSTNNFIISELQKLTVCVLQLCKH
ncbi:hypothetical protein XENORESO_013455 [Xenotaenia resolanae]|uniref:Uncharacterized protein n=1 Tax=Xenotaenia resolanae TaxID=208358 RepID=A0ABV0WMA4_9TELE